MKKILVLLFISLVLSGCFAREEAITFISPKNELLEEGPFLIYYPYDWKISSKIEEENSLIKTFYEIYHPRNRQCRIGVEIWRLQLTRRGADAQMSHILAQKIRSLQSRFEKERFVEFKARTSTSRLGTRQARKLVITANKGSVVRTLVLYTIEQGNRFFMVSYQWHSDWDKTALKSMINVVHSFVLK